MEYPSLSTDLPDDEVSNDAVQLIMVSLFNGLCRLTAALAENGLLTDDQVLGLHDAMTTPLDDPDLRDDDLISFTRSTLEKVLARALVDTREEG
ncbi:hypothetical protein [Sphingomonas alba]|uniref:Uncharacterized protein n=1 Tax=Sphingomonas alba TaxID=2908208 RepID=A0ABT0RNP8_9SPHN|nr:hypothetical protein [Sphingomonas alba]MCL6684097.1 hypothetical protein [Sphingomonas alba]